MLTGGVITGGMKPTVENHQTQGDGERFPHTGRSHLTGAEMGYEAEIGPRTNQVLKKSRIISLIDCTFAEPGRKYAC